MSGSVSIASLSIPGHQTDLRRFLALGFFITLYATLITLFGLAWVLFLIGMSSQLFLSPSNKLMGNTTDINFRLDQRRWQADPSR